MNKTFKLICCALAAHTCLVFGAEKTKNETMKRRRSKCGFYRFLPHPSLVLAVVEAKLANKKQTKDTYKVTLNCPTMKLIDEPPMSYTLKPGRKETIIFKMVVKKNEIHMGKKLATHKCVITRWSKKSNSLDLCNFDVFVWPYGLFDYPCDDYKEGQSTLVRKPEQNGVVIFELQDSTSKIGLFSVYMVNLTCTPRMRIIEKINFLNKLREDKPWRIEMPGNCSGALRQNYIGICHLKVLNLCHIKFTEVFNTTVQLYDGETDECEYLKERLGDLSRHPLAAFFGLNYVETGYLTLVVLIQLLLILVTGIILHVRTMQLSNEKRK
ncbi:uncharacterized protein LOC124448002 [Xenia sp. Carnegie-2017]|uniref:uncharacterized protein LOC124448002 n=1 Tax=Xenia sp. Carnegie-2017 TaxID=2897299 RepID=UPI001F039994|nr:uncharacterized protein LOC124448002 [Xenia sp. Carnegie-2017]